MIVNAQNLASMTVGFSALFNKAFSEAEPNYVKYATLVPSSNASEDYGWLGQLPSMREWIGEREIQNLEAYDYVIKNKEFESTVSVKRAHIEDDAYGIYNPIFTSLGEAASMHPDELCAGLLKKGFTEKCYDGKAYFATDHKAGTGKNAFTYSNKATEKIGFESYGRARTALMLMRGENGRSLNVVPDLLIVSPANEKMGRRILESELINGGDSNIYKGTAKLLVDPQLADQPDVWFLACTSKAVKPIIFQTRRKIQFVSLNKETDTNVFMKSEYIYGCDGRHNAGYGFPQMMYGSTGATAEIV